MNVSGQKITAKGIVISIVAVITALVFIFAVLKATIKQPDTSDSSVAPVTTTTQTTTTRPAPSTTTAPAVVPPVVSTATTTQKPIVTNVPDPRGCIQTDTSTAGWNTLPDTTSEGSDSRPGVQARGHIYQVAFHSGACFDAMVVKTNTDEAVGFEVKYVDKSDVVGIGSGLPVEVHGKYFLRFTLLEALYPDIGSMADLVENPRTNNHATIEDVVLGGSFDGRTVFYLGLKDDVPFAATREDNPERANTKAVTLYVAHQR